MNSSRPSPTADLIQLWIQASNCWCLFETFDSSAPEFAHSDAPGQEAAVAATLTGIDLVRSKQIEDFQLSLACKPYG